MNQHPFNSDDELDTDFKDLERLLGELRFVPRPLNLDVVAPRAIAPSQVSRFSFTRYGYAASLAAGIVLTFAVAALWFSWFMPPSSIIVESGVAPSIQEPSVAANIPPLIVDIVQPPPKSLDVIGRNTATSTSAPIARAYTYRRSPRPSKRYRTTRTKSAIEIVAGLQTKKSSPMPTPSRSAQAEEAAQELLLALDVTQRSLDATRQQIETHLSAVRIPVFPYPIQR